MQTMQNGNAITKDYPLLDLHLIFEKNTLRMS